MGGEVQRAPGRLFFFLKNIFFLKFLRNGNFKREREREREAQ